MSLKDGPRRLPIGSDADVARVRATVRASLEAMGAGALDITKFVTAASELARNTLRHGGGGVVEIAGRAAAPGRRPGTLGLVLTFSDDGPGIADVEQALTDGFTTRRGMGLGLGGARRLSDEFRIRSDASGTRVEITKWVTGR